MKYTRFLLSRTKEATRRASQTTKRTRPSVDTTVLVRSFLHSTWTMTGRENISRRCVRRERKRFANSIYRGCEPRETPARERERGSTARLISELARNSIWSTTSLEVDALPRRYTFSCPRGKIIHVSSTRKRGCYSLARRWPMYFSRAAHLARDGRLLLNRPRISNSRPFCSTTTCVGRYVSSFRAPLSTFLC